MISGQCFGVSVLQLVLFILCIGSTFTSAQLVNGQFFTQGLAILDSPTPRSQIQAGNDVAIAIDLSGNGKLSSFLLPSTNSRAYQSLSVYLVSSIFNVNVTVCPQVFEQDPSSAVPHISWSVPSCLPPGNYNLTLYEASRIDGRSYYSITPIPIVVESTSTTICPGLPPAEPQPQPASPPAEQPWIGVPIVSETISLFPTSNPSESGTLSITSQSPASGTISTTGSITPGSSSSPTTTLISSTMTFSTTVNGIPTMLTSVTTSTPSPSTVGIFVPVNAARGGSSVSVDSLLSVFIGILCLGSVV